MKHDKRGIGANAGAATAVGQHPAGAGAGVLVIRAGLYVVLLAFAAYGGLRAVLAHHDGARDHHTAVALFAASAAMLLVVVFLDVTGSSETAPGEGWTGILKGADGRLSTSKTQTLLWTMGLAYVLLFVTFVQTFLTPGELKGPAGTVELLKNSSWEDYLVLLGGPFAAGIVAKASVVGKLANGTISKSAIGSAAATPGAGAAGADPAAGRAAASDIVNNDAGQADFVDIQYLIFNVVTFTYVAALYLSRCFNHAVLLGAGKYELPAVPNLLLVLSGTSAATYAGNKLLAKGSPTITAVTPSADGSTVISGTLLVADVGPTARARTHIFLSTAGGSTTTVLPSAQPSPTSLRCVLPAPADGPFVSVTVLGAGNTVVSNDFVLPTGALGT